MNPLTRMVEQHIWMTGEMIERAARLTDDQLDAPLGLSANEDDKTLRRLLSRMVGQIDLWDHAFAGERYDFDVEKDEDVDGMRERFAEAAPRFLAEVRDVVAGDRFEDTFVSPMRETVKTYTYGEIIDHVLTFAAHNRTLAIVALKNAGIKDLTLCISANAAEECIAQDKVAFTVDGVHRHHA